MRIRQDFVSNSSSSSFIVNYDCINDSSMDGEVLSLKQYLYRFGKRDLFEYHSVPTVKYVTEKRFNEIFSYGVFATLPNCCKTLYERYKMIHEKYLGLWLGSAYCKPSEKVDDDLKKSWRKEADDILFKILDKLEEVLMEKWGNNAFFYIEYSDDDIQAGYDVYDSCYNDQVKFKRNFSNH